MRGDAAARSAYYTAMLTSGVLSINEVRDLEDYDPIPAGDGHLQALNMTQLGAKPDPGASAGDTTGGGSE
jgi:phage portal protein BeeE